MSERKEPPIAPVSDLTMSAEVVLPHALGPVAKRVGYDW